MKSLLAILVLASGVHSSEMSDDVIVRSSCSSDTTQQWNTRDIGDNLQVWWNSLTSAFAEEEEDGPYMVLKEKSEDRYYYEYSGYSGSSEGLLTLTRNNRNLRGLTWQIAGSERIEGFTEAATDSSSGFLYMHQGDVVYIYPDFENAIITRIVNGTLEKGPEATITGEKCSNGIKELQLKIKDQISSTNSPAESRGRNENGDLKAEETGAQKIQKRRGSVITTCTFATEEWNTRKVAESLKIWWNSVKKLSGLGQGGPSEPTLLTYSRENGDYRPCCGSTEGNSVRTISSAFSSGAPAGLTWQEIDKEFSSGFLYGVPDTAGQFTGDEVLYVYPDFQTGLYGRFVNGTLERGVEARITGQRCSKGIKELKFKLQNKEETWSFDTTNSTYIGQFPTRMDPHERKSVYFGSSTVPGAGDGLFAKRNFLPGELVSYYSGMNTVVNDCKGPDQQNWVMGGGGIPRRWNVPKELRFDVPEQYREITNYRTTLGHKVNHKILGDTVEFSPVLHPVFGPIFSLTANVPILSGEELFANYNWKYNELHPDWYQQSHKEAGLYFQCCRSDPTVSSIQCT